MDRLEIVDISTLPRGKPLESPLCKKRIRAWNPNVQSVARSPKTLVPPVNDDAAPDTDSHVPPVARAPRQNTPQSIAPSFSQLDIVDISTLPRGKPLETPLCKKRIRAWNPKVKSVARSPKTPDPPVDDNAAPDTDSHVPPVARSPRRKTPQMIAPKFCQLEIVDISTLLRGDPLVTPLGKKRKRPKVRSVAKSTKTPDPPLDGDAAPDIDSHVPPVARFPRRKTPQTIAPKFSQLEIVDISTLLRGKLLETPKKRKRASKSEVQSVARSPKTSVPPVDDDAAPDTNSSLPPAARFSPPKKTPLSLAPNTCNLEIVDLSTPPISKQLETPLHKKKRGWVIKVRIVGRSTKGKVTPVVNEATPATNSCLSPAAGFSHRRRKIPIPE